MMEADWLESYYEAIEFFYWEPQHIDRKKCPTISDLMAKLHRMEVTLNHNLDQFFMLAPATLRNELFGELFGQDFVVPFAMHGHLRATDNEFRLENTVQPDFLFVSDSEAVSIEMKVAAKSSISQVLKYALLGLAVELRTGVPRNHYLAILGVGHFQNQWREKFASVSDIRHAISNDDLAMFLSTRPSRFREHQDRFNEIAKHLHLSFISYPELATFLQKRAPTDADRSSGAEVYRKLISGLLSELRRRELAA